MSSELESRICATVYTVGNLAPSGESFGNNRMQAWRKVMRAYRRVDGLVTCGMTACAPGSAPGPTLGNE